MLRDASESEIGQSAEANFSLCTRRALVVGLESNLVYDWTAAFDKDI